MSEKREPDYDAFNKAISKFFEFCEKILNYNNLGSISNPIVVKMNKFIKVYDYMDDEEKVEFINSTLYEPFIQKIIKDDEDFSWITQESITLAIDKKTAKDRSLMFSTVYNKCVKLKIDAEKSIEGLPDTAAEGREELNFPEIFCLYYYRILKQSVQDKNSEKIIKKLSDIEVVLGVGESNPEIKNNAMPGIGKLLGNLGNLGDLGSLLKFDPNNKGVPVGVNFTGIKKMMNNFVPDSNHQVKGMLNNLIGDLEEAKSPQEMIQKAVSKISNGSDIIKMISTENTVPDAIQEDFKEMKTITDGEVEELRRTGKMPESAAISLPLTPQPTAASQLLITSAEEQC